MKKRLVSLVLPLVLLATLASPVFGASLGLSPSSINLEVEGTDTATIILQAHYYSGDIEISLIGIPLEIEPKLVTVDASENPVAVEVTIYGGHCLENQVYEGFIRFTGIAGGNVAMAVQARLKITNIADGIKSIVETSIEPADTVAEEIKEDEPLQDEVKVTWEKSTGTTEYKLYDLEISEEEETSLPVWSKYKWTIMGIFASGILVVTGLSMVYRFIQRRRYG